MLITVDIGNTNIYVAVWNDSQNDKVSSFRFTTFRKATSDEILLRLVNFLALFDIDATNIKHAIIANVVPQMTEVFQQALVGIGVKNIIFLGDILDVIDLPISVDNKREVGEDRIANAYAAKHQFPGENVIVVDMGTATSFDVVLYDKGYIGGAITPGINLAIESLTTATAKLPKISLKKPESICGANTIAAINSGIFYGYIGQVNNIVKTIKLEQKREFRVISTGGLGEIIVESCAEIETYDPDLTIKGLRRIFIEN